MLWFIIISLLVFGLVLLIVEIIFIPGTTVVGVLGVAFSIAGVVMAYRPFGKEVGFYVLLITLLSTAVSLYMSFRSGAWSKFSLHSSIKSKFNEGITAPLHVGDEGHTMSALRPFGKAEFGQTVIEVKSFGSYVEPNSKVKIIQIDGNQIIVDIIS